MTWAATGDLIDKFGLTKQKLHSIWCWLPGLKCLSNDEASLAWLVLQGGPLGQQKTLHSEAGNFIRVCMLAVIWRSPFDIPSLM